MKNPKNIKMIVMDLDNTLLSADKTISDYTACVLNKCRQNGIKTAIATARPKRILDEFLIEFSSKIHVDSFAVHNGAVIYADGEKIFHCGIPSDITKNILNSIIRDFPKLTVSVEADDVCYSTVENLSWEHTKIKNADFSDLPDKPAEKIITGLSHINGDIKSLEKYLPENLYAQIDSGTPPPIGIIMNREATKYNAVKIFADYYNYDITEIAAFGDDYNDVEMLKQCGVGVAVSNAIEEAKAVADYICGSNDDDGVAKWIDEKLIKNV